MQVGNSVQPGQSLMTVVPLHNLWIDANFKESQLRHVRIGQPVKIEADIYGGSVEYPRQGRSASVPAPAACSRCCPRRTPPATGSRWCSACRCASRWTTKDLDKHPLRIGLSTVVTVDITDDSGHVLAQAPVDQAGRRDRRSTTQVAAKADAEADTIVQANLGASAATAN